MKSVIQKQLSINKRHISYLEDMIICERKYKTAADKAGNLEGEHVAHNELKVLLKMLKHYVQIQKMLKKMMKTTKVPSETTKKAIAELDDGESFRFVNFEDLMNDCGD